MDVSSQQTITTQSMEENPRKMFVGGLSWQTTAESLQEYFGKFGEIKECMVMKDPITKRSRGFGFVTFMDLSAVEKVMTQANSAPHVLDSKKIDPKVAVPKKGTKDVVPNGLSVSSSCGVLGSEVTKSKKVFVGGISTNTNEEDIKRYFEKFGKVSECMLLFDKNTKRNRGFAFVTFEDEDCAASACRIHFHDLNGRMVEAKMAQPKEVMNAVNATKNFAGFVPSFFPPGFPAAYAAYSRPFSYPVHYIPGFSGYTGATYIPGSENRQATVTSPTTAAYYADYLSPGGSSAAAAANLANPAALAAAVQAARSEQSALTLNTALNSRQATDLASYSLMNNFPQGYGTATSPAAQSRGFPPANSPGSMDIYSANTDSLSFVQATSPQPTGFTHNLTVSGTLIPPTFQNGFH